MARSRSLPPRLQPGHSVAHTKVFLAPTSTPMSIVLRAMGRGYRATVQGEASRLAASRPMACATTEALARSGSRSGL